MNKEELENIISQIVSTKVSGEISIRELHNALGWEKRSSRSIPFAKKYLLDNSIITNPDLESTWDWHIDSKIKLKYNYTETSEDFRLYYLRVVGYKNLNIDLDLLNSNNYCCLIGLNGSGKSNVLEAISKIFFSLYHIATLKDGLRKYPCKFNYTIRYTLRNNFYEITNGRLENGEQITIDILPKNIIASYSGEDTRLWKECYKPIYEKYRSTMVATPGFVPPYMFYISRYEWEISLLTLLYSEDVDVVKFIKETLGITNCNISFEYNTSNIRKWEGTNIEALIEAIKETSVYTIDSFREKISNISFIDRSSTLFYCLYKCRTDGDNQVIKKINISCGRKGSLEGLSEGEKKLINANVVIHILSTPNSLCLFDEPDAHIHISRQKDLKQLFRDYNRYSIVTTHSPVFLDIMYDDNNIRFMSDGKALDTTKLKQINKLTDGTINYFEGAFILSSKRILVVEGKYDDRYLKKAIDVFSKSNNKYKKLNEIAVFSANGASEAEIIYKQAFEHCIDRIEKIVFLFDYDDGGWKDGWKKIKAIHDVNSKVIPLFYQDNYSSTAYPTSDNDVKIVNGDKCIKKENSFLVEDLFSENSYSDLIFPVISARKHKDFRKLTFGKNGTAGAIKEHIQKEFNDFNDSWYIGFQPVLDKLMEVFDLN